MKNKNVKFVNKKGNYKKPSQFKNIKGKKTKSHSPKINDDEYEMENYETLPEELEMDEEIEDNEESESENEEEEEIENEDLNEESDDDFSGEESEDDGRAPKGFVTIKMISQWERDISRKSSSVMGFKNIQRALTAAVNSIKGSEGVEMPCQYTVKGPQIFNAVIRLCLRKIPETLYELFGLKTLSDRPAKNKKWTKLKISIKKFLKDYIMLLKSLTDPKMVGVLLKKGVLPLLPFFAEFPLVSWQLTKQVSILWCTSDERVRVLSVVSLFRLIRSFDEEKKERIFKLLYVSFINNCRFTSPVTWPMIDFMRMSLIELYTLDEILAYRHAFIYIRNLACHLRNAMLVQKKERLQLVYNWQFLHSLHFWAELLGKTHPSSVLQPLIYPVVQICTGVITLQKSPKYFPLIFHICSILTELSQRTDTFIPVLTYLIEVLSSQRLHTKPKKTSIKPFNWNSILKVSDAEMTQSAFTDGLVEEIYDSCIKYLNIHCNSIGFPELVFPLTEQIKTFVKNCRVVNYTKKMNQLLKKINENSEFINDKRKEVPFAIKDSEAIKNWEIEVEQSICPFRAFFNQWKSTQTGLKRLMEMNPCEGEDDSFSIASLRKREKHNKRESVNVDKEEEEEEEEKQAPPPKKMKKEEEGDEGEDDDYLDEDIDDGVFEEDVVKEMKLSDYEESDSEH